MAVEVDQSGKIEQLDTTTVVACANDTSSAVSIKASEKRKLFLLLRTSIVSKDDRLAVIFAVLVFLLLQTLQRVPSTIILDEEYTGKDSLVIEILEKLLMRSSKGTWHGSIRVQRIGKHSPAHLLSWSLHRRVHKRRSIAKVNSTDIMRWWQ